MKKKGNKKMPTPRQNNPSLHLCFFFNPRRACAARVTVLGLSVCLSVCLSVDSRRLANLAVQGTGRPMTATNRFRVARSLILIGRFS